MKFRLFLLIFLTCLILQQTSNAKAVLQVSSPIEKKKTKKKKKRKKALRLANRKEQKNIENAVAPISITSIIIVAIGAALFCFGIAFSIPVMWLIGLISMGVANLFILTLSLIIFSIKAFSVREGAALILGYSNIILIALNVLFFLIFLIWGLSISFPILWITALVILAVAIAIFCAYFLLN